MGERLPKIILAIANVGAGHKSAAYALEQVFASKYPNQYDVKTIDFFTVADPMPLIGSDASYKTVSGDGGALLKFHEAVWHFCNSRIGHPFFSKFLQTRTLKAYKRVIELEQPDLIVSIHPYVSLVLGKIKQQSPQMKMAVVISDLAYFDRSWAEKRADLIVCPTEEACDLLQKWGVASEKIVSGLFPIQPKMRNYRKREKVITELGLDPGKPLIMLTGGGVGTGSMGEAVERLADKSNWQVLIIAGRNNAVLAKLQKKFANYPNVVILGFVDNMQDYINAADIVVAKPGPATILEIELLGTRGVFTKAIGPQEVGNIPYILRNPNFRYIADDWSKLLPYVEELLLLTPDADGTRRKFDEAEQIVEKVLELIG